MKAVVQYIIIVLGFVAPIVELAWRLCSNIFFNPMPTLIHVVIVLCVPISLIVLKQLIAGEYSDRRNRLALPALVYALVFSTAYSIWFAPIAPLCGLGILFLGVGLLGWTPFLLLGLSLFLFRDWARWLPDDRRSHFRRKVWWCSTLIVPALVILWWQPIVTIAAARLLNSEKLASKYAGLDLLSYCVSESHLQRQGLQWEGFWNLTDVDPATMRQAYFYIYGSRPGVPRRTSGLLGSPIWEFDEDQGSTTIGRKLQGLSLSESALDIVGRFAEDYTYTEWTMTFANASAGSLESRAVIQLPPNSVVSKASLWIDGEEREAAFGTNSQVKTIYQQVVTARRDPFLVTVIGPDQVQMQCFPVPRNGTMKIRLGITSPLTNGRTFTLPHFIESNFDISGKLKHNLVIAADSSFKAQSFGQQASATKYQNQLSEDELSGNSPQFTFDAIPPAEYRLCNGSLSFRASPLSPMTDRKVVLLIDGQEEILRTLESISIPAENIAGLVVSRPFDVSVWDGSSDLRQFLKGQPGYRGTSSGPALVMATNLSTKLEAPIVWIHGGLPPEYREQLQLEQLFRRSDKMIAIVTLGLTNQMNTIISDPFFFRHFIPIRRTGEPLADLSAAIKLAQSIPPESGAGADTSLFLGGRFSSGIQITQRGETPVSHPYRLWVNARVMSEYFRTGSVSDELKAAAIKARIVTPVTGAVVLENKSQYESAQLDPTVGAENVPKIPEPEFYVLLCVVVMALIALAYARKRGLVC